MIPTIKAIFFDIGGTLRVSDDKSGRDSRRIEELIAFLGENCSVEDFSARIRRGEKAYRKWSKPAYLELSEVELWSRFLLPEYPKQFIQENAVKINQLWRESHVKHLLPDMTDTMRELSRRGYKLGLISNTTSSVEGHQILAENNLTELFSCVILSAVFGRRKPHPSLFIEAARQAGVHPQECAYVGDRPSRDLLGARQSNYGEAVIINAEGYFNDEFDPDDYEPEKDTHLILKPDHSIGRLSELLDFYPGVKESNPDVLSNETPCVMYDAALSTMWGVDQKMPFNETFAVARQAGFGRFELNHKVIPAIFDQWDKDRFYISSVHDPCPAVFTMDDFKVNDFQISSLDEARRIKGVDIVKASIDTAYSLGAKTVVIHPGMIVADRSRDQKLREMYRKGLKNTPEYETLKREMIAHRSELARPHFDQVLKSISEIIEYTRPSGLCIGLENRYRYYDIPIIEEMDELMNLCEESWFGFQYDSGHAQTLGALGICEHEEWLKRFGKRIIGTHLHDVQGIMDHQQPGVGDVDFEMIARYLPATAYRTLEVAPELTLDEIRQGMEVLANAGCVARL